MRHPNAPGDSLAKNVKASAIGARGRADDISREVLQANITNRNWSFMLPGSSEVVGLIEIDAGNTSLPACIHRPMQRPARTLRQVRRETPCGDAETVHADLTRINAELRVELAHVVARIAKARMRK